MTERQALRRRRTFWLAVPLAIVIAAGEILSSPAQAQERPRNIMEMLFGAPVQEPRRQQVQPRRGEQAQPQRRQIRRQNAQPRRQQARQQPRRSQQPSRSKARREPAAPAPVVVSKSDTAKDVLVIGDFLAASLGRGLTETTADNRDVRIVARTDGSSGLVRDDHYDWLANLPKIIEETSPDLVAVMLGSNDRQAIRGANGSLTLRSEEWTAEYTRRTLALAEIVGSRDIPLIWVGTPSFQSQRMTEDMVFFNDLYRRAAASVDGEFVDIWGGFVDANGAFTTSGPDPEGQPARLRNSDGITMAPAGQAKLAYYAEKPIIKRLGLSVDDLLVSLAPQQLPEDDLPEVDAGQAANAVSAPPVAFTDPALDGGDALLGGGPAASPSLQPSPRERLVLSGLPSDSIEGRADSFNWNGKGAAVSPITQENAIVFRGSTSLDALRAPPPAPAQPAPAGAGEAAEEGAAAQP